MSTIFYIDTSEAVSQILLMNEHEIIARRSNIQQQDHGSQINLHLADMLQETQKSWGNIDAVAVLNGPGSYTGLRISLATAKGICYAKELPLILLNKLDLHSAQVIGSTDMNFAVVLKAREQEYFSAFYKADGETLHSPSLRIEEDIKKLLNQEQAEIFSTDDNLQEFFPEIALIEPTEEVIHRTVWKNFIEKKWADLVHAEPFYLKNVFINKINKL